jgi:hypothetical protein
LLLCLEIQDRAAASCQWIALCFVLGALRFPLLLLSSLLVLVLVLLLLRRDGACQDLTTPLASTLLFISSPIPFHVCHPFTLLC